MTPISMTMWLWLSTLCFSMLSCRVDIVSSCIMLQLYRHFYCVMCVLGIHFTRIDDHLHWHPPLIRHYTNFWPYYWSGPCYRIWLFTQLREVSLEHLQRVRHANRGRLLLRTPGPIPWDTWSCPILGLASVLMSRPISPDLVLFPDFWVSNIPRYFCFCLLQSIMKNGPFNHKGEDFNLQNTIFPTAKYHHTVSYYQRRFHFSTNKLC